MMIHYHKTHQNTARIVRTACNELVCRNFCGLYCRELSTARGSLTTATVNTDRSPTA
jgi:hypothetical protein